MSGPGIVVTGKLNGSLRCALVEVAKAELAGNTIGGKQIARQLGVSDSTGLGWRAQLLALKLVRVDGKVGCASTLRLTLEGWAAVGGRAAVKPAPSGAKERNCLGCGSPFPSEGPGNRLCNSCRTQSGDDTYRILPR